MTARIPIPIYDGGPDRGTRNDRADYLEPMAERWPGGDLLQLVDWLAVDHSRRWQKRLRPKEKPTDPDRWFTYCDHYAADFIEQACGQQLISAWVWWTDAALRRLQLGETVPVVYGPGGTVREHGARSLHDWMRDHGQRYGWHRVHTDAALREQLNDRYTIGLILTPTHVAVALPDVVASVPGLPPLQSQAGSRNVRLWRQDDWYRRNAETVRVWLEPSALVSVKRPSGV
jgi:hypothetical protein